MMKHRIAVVCMALMWTGLAVFVAGCFGAQEAGEAEGAAPDSGGAYYTADVAEGASPELADTSPDVRTIQLYRGTNESAMPIYSLRTREPLTLEFDVMRTGGRALSVYFYHADRTWERDLSPAQYLESFQSDNLIDYRPSRSTEVPYTHYTYQFPNEDIRFRVSGNYIIRVTEQGQPDDVLFERPFFVTEEASALQVGVENIVVTGQQQPSDRPVAQFTPPATLQADAFRFGTCFIRNGRFAEARCAERPRLAERPSLRFELDRRDAFSPRTADYFLDLSRLQPGGEIERADRSVSPWQMLLEPDFARFSGDAFAPLLFNQIRVREVVRNVSDPEVAAEYVEAIFSFVPPNEQLLSAPVRIGGSFADGRAEQDLRLEWVPERGRYEAALLLKQGQYEYFYASDDAALRAALAQGLSRAQDLYTAFVYYDDPTLNTDRLLAVQNVRAM